MAEADCELCLMVGYRSCDECGSPVFPHVVRQSVAAGLGELCGYCLEERGVHVDPGFNVDVITG